MKDKEKQIEEMAKDIFDCHDALEGIDFAFGYGKDSHFERIAKKLTAIGYRKIPEGAVVLTKEEYDEIKSALEVSHAYMVKEAYRIGQASKKTAKEILQNLYDHCFEIVDPYDNDCEESFGVVDPCYILNFAENYGVEVEE